MAAIIKKLQKGVKLCRKILENIEEKPKEEDAVVHKKVTHAQKNHQSIKTYTEENKLPEFRVDGLVFSLFTEQDIKNLTVCEVKEVNKSYNPTFSTDDPRLGTIEDNKLCATCNKTNQDCAGHLGRIELPVSIIHPFFRDIVIMVLKTICFTCNKLLVTEKIIKDQEFHFLKGRKRLSAIADFCKNVRSVRCTNPRCGVRPIFIAKSGESIRREVLYKYKDGKKENLEYISVETIKMKLDAISDKDAKLLGFDNNHPRNFIINFIPVIPLSSRPYTIREGERTDDSLTSAYCNILNKKTEAIQQEELDKKEDIYKEIIEYYDFIVRGMKNSDKGFSKGSKKDVLKAIFDRITTKEGIIRKYILGKRMDFSGRTVVGPNHTLQFNHVALPRGMRLVTIPEIVTKYNLERIKKLAARGEISYVCPKKGDNAGVILKFNINRRQINIGDKIGRYTQKGDVVLFNRQPTLQLNSMIGQIVDFQDKGSVGLHLSSTPGLNADFDGDEMNIHFLQTVGSQVEARLIMAARANIISNADSRPQSVLVYNSISGGYLLTGDNVLFTKDEFDEGVDSMRYLTSDFIQKNLKTLFLRAEYTPSNGKQIPGKLLCSVLFPHDFWYRNGEVFISNGILREGRLTKTQMGSSHGSLVQYFVKWYGNKIASDFISAANFLFNWYIQRSGLTIGLGDCVPEGLKEFKKFRDREIRDLNNRILSLKTREGQYSREEEIDKKVEIIQNTSNLIETELMKIIPKNNNLSLMMDSGAKGKKAYTMHMIGFKGQVLVGNSLPQKKLTEGKRWLTTFHVNDNSIYSTGFSGRSFLEGLEPDAYFAMAQEGRLNVIDRQLRTAETGYMQRLVTKAEEDLIVGYDGSVYSQTGNIVQFNYGLGFAVNKMVEDISEEGDKFYSFINIGDLCGRVNNQNGFHKYSIGQEVVNIFNETLKSYDYKVDYEIDENQEEDEEDEGEVTIEEDFNEDFYIDDDDGEDFDFDE
jgi:DNA-directed RNA polymerase beta' subunit